jgi:NADP-dependent 3-hydroxy acid dehydrogenase YdfG
MVNDAVEKTVATFGRLDVLVSHAGTAIPKTFEQTYSATKGALTAGSDPWGRFGVRPR